MMNVLASLPRYAGDVRITRFGRGATSLRSKTPLTDEQIRIAAPSVFQEQAHESRSSKFAVIPTAALLEPLRKEGFLPYSVTQGGSGDENKRAFTKHAITFRRDEPMPTVVGGSILEVGLINAADGTSSWQLFLRMLKLACLNGLVVDDPTRESFGVRVGHRGNPHDAVIEGTYKVLDGGGEAFGRVEKFERLQLTGPEQSAFAKAAAELRFDHVPLNPDMLNHARRPVDEGPSLWRTFNRVQENVIRGGLGYTSQNEQGRIVRHSTRPIQSIDGDTRLNRALWVLADQMAQLKAA